MIEAILIGVASVIGAFFAGLMRGKSAQKNNDEAKRLAAQLESERKRVEILKRNNEVRREVDNLDDGGAVERLRGKWTRD